MAQKVRVLLLDTSHVAGGLEMVHADLLRTLDRTRFDVYLACIGHGPLLSVFQSIPDVTLWKIDVGTRSGKWCAGWRGRVANVLSVVPLFVSAVRIAHRCRISGIQVIHTSTKKRSVLLTLLLNRLTRLPFLYHIHGTYDDYPANRRALARAAVIIANSADSRQDYILARGPEMNRIRVVHNGIDAAHFRPGLSSGFRDEIGVAPGAVLIGITSRLASDKGQETFLRAAAIVARAEPQVRFAMVGDDAICSDNCDYIPMLKRIVTEQGLADRVIFAGFRSDMAAVYTGLDVLVNAARREAFGLVVVEAMACGKAVVGTESGGIPEIVTHGRDGFLFPPRDARRLAEILLDLVRQPELRQRIGVAARATVLERFSVQTMARAVEKVYVELASPMAKA